ncbi:MAG: hypothetical protein KDI51_10075, partial [Xanthomonadales bacterium]|nr:hypothetical protein [Xanthomonadales bacterium]
MGSLRRGWTGGQWGAMERVVGGSGHSRQVRLSAWLCAVWLALTLPVSVVLAQPGPPPDAAAVTLSASEKREVVLALAEVLRERFAFRERGREAARQIEALELRGAFRDARTAAELLSLIEEQIAPIVNDGHFRARYFGPEMVAGFSDAPPSADEVAAFHDEVRLRGGEIPEVRWLPGNVGYLRISR